MSLSVDGGSNGLSLDVVLVSFGGWLLPSGGLKYGFMWAPFTCFEDSPASHRRRYAPFHRFFSMV